MSVLELFFMLFIFLAIVIIVITLVRQSSKIKDLTKTNITNQDKLKTFIDKNTVTMKNLVDSVNFNDNVVSTGNNDLHNYVTNTHSFSNKRIKNINNGIRNLKESTKDNIHTLDKNIRYNIEKLHYDTNEMDNKYALITSEQIRRIDHNTNQMNNIQQNKVDKRQMHMFMNKLNLLEKRFSEQQQQLYHLTMKRN